jgi:carboxyl-terminal processing protease
LLSAAICCALLLSSPAYSQSKEQPSEQAEEEIRRSLERITAVFDAVSTHLADPVDPEKAIYEGAIPGVVSRLDPFSVFLNRDQFQSLQQQQRGVRQGFGAVLSVQAGKVTVLQSVPDSPFGRAGLGPGDRIVGINRHRVASLDLEELVQVLEQARSGKVLLSVLQGGSVVARDFELDPSEVPSPTVDKKFLLEPRLGYLHVARIEQSTPSEIEQALAEWKESDLRGLLLDLRDNPGGSLDAAVETAGLFLPEEKTVVSLQGRAMPARSYRTIAGPHYPRLPLVVLLNERAASAAEIIAAALQEHDRAWLVGKQSFGKGVVESVLPLSEGAALVLTTARYLTPLGRSVQKPLPGTALAGILDQGPSEFVTETGRRLREAGGVLPDQIAEPWRLEEWTAWLQQSTAFVNFAEAYLERHGAIGEDFRADEGVLNEFERFLRQAGFSVLEQQWQQALPFLKMRIEAEIFNLVFGIAKGDEVEVRADPQVQAAAAVIQKAEELLARAGTR